MSTVSFEIEQDSTDADGAERRRTTRTDLIVRIDYSTVDEFFSEFTRDINEGGLFIETEKPRPAGTEVTMHFQVPGSRDGIQTVGRVVRISSGDAQMPPGMGIEFDELTDEDQTVINSIVRSLKADVPS
jgi:uncharacterized protein (TIGR02266 family)